jgi:hypothetical protein
MRALHTDMAVTLPGKRWIAHQLIDEAAGCARRKHITETAGQQAVYLIKLQQAERYLAALAASEQAEPGAYIAAEAAALGMLPQQLAADVVATAAAWNDVLGPSIEAARRSGKVAVSEAPTAAAINDALHQALQALRAIG